MLSKIYKQHHRCCIIIYNGDGSEAASGLNICLDFFLVIVFYYIGLQSFPYGENFNFSHKMPEVFQLSSSFLAY